MKSWINNKTLRTKIEKGDNKLTIKSDYYLPLRIGGKSLTKWLKGLEIPDGFETIWKTLFNSEL